MNAGTNIKAIIRAAHSAVLILTFSAFLFFISSLSILVVSDEISGTIAIAIDEIKVPGMVRSGRAMPVIIPNSAIA